MPIKAPTLIANYLPNAETILDYAHEHGKFFRREEGTKFFHQAKRTGPISAFSSWFIAKDHPCCNLLRYG